MACPLCRMRALLITSRIGVRRKTQVRRAGAAGLSTLQWNGRLRFKSCAFAFRLDRAPTDPLRGGVYDNHPPSQRHPVSQYMRVLKRE